MRVAWGLSSLTLTALTALVVAQPSSDPFERSAGVIGLLALPEVFGESVCVKFEPRPIDLFATATSATPTGQIRVTRPWRFPPEGGCEGLEVRVFRGSDGAPEELPTLEYGYEEAGAIAIARAGGRMEIALRTGSAWVAAGDTSRFHPVETLLTEGLGYLRPGSLQQLRASPDESSPLRRVAEPARADVPVQVLEFRTVEARRWVRVALQAENECSGESTGVKADTVWLPFHGEDRKPTVWFYSRGC